MEDVPVDRAPPGEPGRLRSTVWLVRLGTADEGRRGVLELEERELAFTSEELGHDLRVPLAAVGRIRKTLGSPVLLVEYAAADGIRRLALYFAQPPPLPSSGGVPRHKGRVTNVSYLAQTSADRRDAVRRWRRELREAVRKVRGG